MEQEATIKVTVGTRGVTVEGPDGTTLNLDGGSAPAVVADVKSIASRFEGASVVIAGDDASDPLLFAVLSEAFLVAE